MTHKSERHNAYNFIIRPTAANQPLLQKITQYQNRNKEIQLFFTNDPAPEHETSVYIVHESRAFELLNPSDRPKTWLPVICFGPEHHLKQTVLLGCSDYLKDPWAPFELFFRISRLIPETIFKFSWGDLALTSMAVCVNGREISLSLQEYRILKTLVQNRGDVVPRDVLFYSLWGKTGNTSRAVDMHVSSLRNKFRPLMPDDSSKSLIRTVHHVGYTIL